MDNSGREGEEALFDIIRSSPSPEHEPEDDDGSQYLNNSGEGCMIFDEEKRIDEGDNNDVDEENVLQITKTGEVYILYKPSGDHYMS